MSLRQYTRFELAHNQLETAIHLYITNRDRLSAITLAGAADVLLSQLVLKSGRPNFTDILVEDEHSPDGTNTSREVYGKEVNDLLFINQLKHFDKDAQEDIELDIDECALAAILKALVNYTYLPEHDRILIDIFKTWIQTNPNLKKYTVEDDPN